MAHTITRWLDLDLSCDLFYELDCIETDNHRYSSLTPRPLYTLWWFTLWSEHKMTHAHGLALRYWVCSKTLVPSLWREVTDELDRWSLARCGHGKTASAFFRVLRSHQGSHLIAQRVEFIIGDVQAARPPSTSKKTTPLQLSVRQEIGDGYETPMAPDRNDSSFGSRIEGLSAQLERTPPFVRIVVRTVARKDGCYYASPASQPA
jgi:hypothetical protein